ncbi:MAG: WecB/TagA/CpsF family glycosyltransferase [Acidobacteriota bacterium]|nr:WecB/TagA/CpsF family glycosyltransferase [Acidobacteriota bacterium]
MTSEPGLTVPHAESTPGRHGFAKYEVLGIRFAALQIADVIRQAEAWIAARTGAHTVTVSNVHSVMESRHNPRFAQTLNAADLNVPDGMPIIWLGRRRGFTLPRRVYGPDLFLEFCRDTAERGYRHYFYGSTEEVVTALIVRMKDEFPGFQVAGYCAPPFRPLNAEEDRAIVEDIESSSADVLWVGLGCPKQEFWMEEHRAALTVPVIFGVGQAFNIHAGKLRQAPKWMREHGLEWLFRLWLEPRRLWRRYLVYNTQFLFGLLMELLRGKPRA